MVRKQKFYRLALVVGALLCVLAGDTKAQLSFSRDTVHSIDVINAFDTVLLANLGSDTLTIDSIFIERDSVQMYHCAISVSLLPLRPELYYAHYTFSPLWPPYHYNYNLVTVPPHHQILWHEWYLKAYQPLPDGGHVYTGETLGALLIFHAGPYIDSLVVMGLGACESCVGVRERFRPGVAVSPRSAGGPLVDLTGKRVDLAASRRPKGVYVREAGGRACVVFE